MEVGEVKTIIDTVNMTVIKAIKVTMEFSHQNPNGHLHSKHRQIYGYYSHQGHQNTTDIAVIKTLTQENHKQSHSFRISISHRTSLTSWTPPDIARSLHALHIQYVLQRLDSDREVLK
jgi:hypothetical protein